MSWIAVAAGVGVVGGTLIGANQSKVSAPADRNYYQEGYDTLKAQLDLAPDILAAEQKTRPEYAKLDLNILRDTLLGQNGQGGGLIDIYGQAAPQLGALQEAANTQQRASDIGDVAALGPAATEAFRNANPQLAGLQDQLAERASAGGDSQIMAQLRKQAMGDLRLGGGLSEAQQRDAEQAALSAFNSRGIARSDAGAFAEALGRYNYANDLQDRRRAFAMGVDSMDLQRQNYGSNLLGSAVNTIGAQSQDPFMAILGRPSGAVGAAQSSVGQGGFSLSSAPTIFNPYDPYAGALYASNQQNQLDAATATAANKASIYGAGIGALGKIGGSFCWVARAAYGEANPMWLRFREWMLEDAPAWFRALYIRRGARVGAWLDRHAWAKRPVRVLMDRAIAAHEARERRRFASYFELQTA